MAKMRSLLPPGLVRLPRERCFLLHYCGNPNYILKVGIEVIMTPITLVIIRWLKGAEHEDYYDTNTDFNPFRVGDAG